MSFYNSVFSDPIIWFWELPWRQEREKEGQRVKSRGRRKIQKEEEEEEESGFEQWIWCKIIDSLMYCSWKSIIEAGANWLFFFQPESDAEAAGKKKKKEKKHKKHKKHKKTKKAKKHKSDASEVSSQGC